MQHSVRTSRSTVLFVKNSYFLEDISLYEHFLGKRYIRTVVDTGSSAGHIGRGPGAIRASWSAWKKASKLFFRSELTPLEPQSRFGDKLLEI